VTTTATAKSWRIHQHQTHFRANPLRIVPPEARLTCNQTYLNRTSAASHDTTAETTTSTNQQPVVRASACSSSAQQAVSSATTTNYGSYRLLQLQATTSTETADPARCWCVGTFHSAAGSSMYF
jgi:hypothetical protein